MLTFRTHFSCRYINLETAVFFGAEESKEEHRPRWLARRMPIQKARVLAGRVYDTGLQAICLPNVRARDFHSSAPGLHPTTSPKCLCNAGMSKQEINIISIEVECENFK